MPKLNWNGATLLIAACALSFATSVHGADPSGDFSFMTLNGLDKAAVEIQGVHRDFKRYGLEASTVKSAVETKLQEHGIAVVSLDDAKRIPNAVLIQISLNANQDQVQIYFYGISLEVKQKIPINQAGGFISQNIWSTGKTGVIDPADLGRMNGYIDDLLNLFLRDFHDQNRREVSAVP
jgi:hypothetical protein